jgi:hypothetical protein
LMVWCLLAYRGDVARRSTTNDIDDDVRTGAREDMSRLLDELRAGPELNDLDDEQSMGLVVMETRAVRRERDAQARGCTSE